MPRNTAQQEKLRRGRLKRGGCLAAAGYRGNQQNAIAFLEGAGFAAEEADVLFVEGVGDGGCATGYFRRAVGEAAERCWDFNGYGHFVILLIRFQFKP